MAASPTTLVGNITADPVLSYTAAGAAKLAFSVAVNHVWRDAQGEQQKKVSYFDCVVWRDTAEAAADVLEKGVGVMIAGRLEQRSWEDKETGQKRSKVEVVVDDVAVNVRAITAITRRPPADYSGDNKSGGAGGGQRRPSPRPQQQVPNFDEEAF
jgi:single-strand DNA-binding protein